jgi:hypothetical protein
MLRGQWLDCAFRRFASLLMPGRIFLEWLGGGEQNSGAEVRRENDFSCRHCERSEAIQGGLLRKLDCFVAMARRRPANARSPRNDEWSKKP